MIKFGKASGSIGAGAFCCGLSVLWMAFYTTIMILIENNYRDFRVDESFFSEPRVLITFILMGSASLFIFILGVLEIKRGLTDKKVRANGKRSVCRIEDFKVRSNRYGHSIRMKVKFKTASGQQDYYSASVGQDAINKFKQGMMIECYVLGENCYVDKDNLRAVETGEDLFQ